MAKNWTSLSGCLFVLIGFWGSAPSQANKATMATIGVIYKEEDSALYDLMKWTLNKRSPRTAVKVAGVPTRSEDLLTHAVMKELSGAVIVFDLSFVDQRSFTLADILMVPVISMKPILEEIDFQFPVSSRPYYMMYAQGIVDVLSYFMAEGQNEGATIIYEAGYSRLATKISALAMKKGRSVDIIPELPFNRPDKRKKALHVLRKLLTRYVVVICHPSNLQWIMGKVTRMGVINKNSRWFAVDMELSGNISSSSLKGLVGLRLSFKDEAAQETATDEIKERNIPIKPGLELNYAILRDTLSAVLKVFNDNSRTSFEVDGADKECPLKDRTDTMGNMMFKELSEVTIDGLTGLVKFDPKLRRRIVKELAIVNVKELAKEGENEIVQVGTWKPSETKGGSSTVKLTQDNNVDWNGEFWEEQHCKADPCGESASKDRRQLVVATRIDEPFCFEKTNGYEGFSVDLLNEIAVKLGFNYTLRIFNGTADMIRALRQKKVDIAIGAITINAKRERKIDFSKPFMDFRVGMILPKPKAEDINVFAFMLPFHSHVWLCIMVAVVAVTLFVYFLDRFSPYGYHAQAKQSDPAKGGDELNLFNSLWFTAGSILGQGAENTPCSASGRILAGAFWFFTLILLSTYTANLAAYFTAKSSKNTIKSLEDLVAQKEIKYGVYEGGSIHDFFKSSTVSPYKEMNYNMQTYEGAFVNSTKAGVDKVLQSNFAYLTDQPYLDYYNKIYPCNTTLVKHLLETKGYGIALQRNSDLTNCFSVTILELVEKEKIKKLRERWWTDSGDNCQNNPTVVTKGPLRLKLHNVAGVFIILLAGMGASFVLLLVERRCGNLRDLVAERGSIRSVLRPNDEVQAGKVFVNNTETGPQERHLNKAERSNCKVVHERKLASAYANAPESKV